MLGVTRDVQAAHPGLAKILPVNSFLRDQDELKHLVGHLSLLLNLPTNAQP